MRNTMTQTTATRQAAATASSRPLRSREPKRTLKKRPLNKKNRRIPMELFTLTSVSNEAERHYWHRGPGTTTRGEPGSWTTGPHSATVPGSKHGASAVRLRVKEPKGKPVRIRRGPATVTEALADGRTPSAGHSEVRYLLQRRSRRSPRRERTPPRCRGAPTRFDLVVVRPGSSQPALHHLADQ